MYRADYHTHSSCSPDGSCTMAELAEQAIAVGLQELCITDHVDTILWARGTVYGTPRESFCWQPAIEQFQQAQSLYGERITLRLGAELGEVTQHPDAMERFLQQAPALDFCIGSVHTVGEELGWQDLFSIPASEPEHWDPICRSYLKQVYALAQWGKFDVLGHLTLPARYAWDRCGIRLDFTPYRDEIAAIFTALIDRGRGIEVNTNRGNLPLPHAPWLRLYRDLGGERITIGSDAHTTQYIGCAVASAQELLRSCGFRYFNTYQKHEASFHRIDL